MNRRGFIAALSGAGAAGKRALASAAEDLAGLGAPFGSGAPAPSAPVSAGSGGYVAQRLKDIARAKIDPFYMDLLRRNAREQIHVHNLDPDLASNRSMSLVTKVRLQRERNIERWLKENLSVPGWMELQDRSEGR